MTPVSAVIITYNEAKNIKRCLESLVEVVDEIIVVDSFSEDNTPEICAEFPVKFIQREWQGYAATKNWANEQATHPYLLSVDADEALDNPLKSALLTARKQGLSGAYAINRKTNYCGHWVRFCGWYPDRKIRVFHRNEAVWEGDFVHETLSLKHHVKVKQLSGHLHHYSYHSLQDHRSRTEKYAKLHAKKMNVQGKQSSILKAYLSAAWKFFQVYFLKLGLFDGMAGMHIARYSARAVFLKYRYLTELQRQPHENNH